MLTNLFFSYKGADEKNEDLSSFGGVDKEKNIHVSSKNSLEGQKSECDMDIEEGVGNLENESLRQPTPERCDSCEKIDEFARSKSDVSESADDNVSLPSATEKGSD